MRRTIQYDSSQALVPGYPRQYQPTQASTDPVVPTPVPLYRHASTVSVPAQSCLYQKPSTVSTIVQYRPTAARTASTAILASLSSTTLRATRYCATVCCYALYCTALPYAATPCAVLR
eukprot:3076676-Rhodomonas_salina.1